MIVLRRILFLLVNLFLALALVFRVIARRVLRKRTRWLRVDLRGDVRFLPRRANYSRFLMGFAPPPREVDLRALERSIDAALKLPAVEGVIVVVHPLAGGYASIAALRDILRKISAGGKRGLVFLPSGGGMKELLVASGGSEIIIGRGATLALGGLSASTRYMKGALDRLGVEIKVHRRAEYKSALEPYANETMSAEQREQSSLLLGGISDEIAASIAESRGLSEEAVRSILARPLISDEEAVELGLADRAAYEDELESILERETGDRTNEALPHSAPPNETGASPNERTRAGDRRDPKLRPLPLSVAMKLAEPQDFLPVRSMPLIALIRVEGGIMDGDRARASYDRLKRALRWARASKQIRGALLFIDSPGGSAQASELIHREIVRLREKKPVMAYFGDVAASGGYFVGVGAQKIFASPLSVTGSIGVIAAKPSLEGLYEKLGVRIETVKTSPSADFFALHRSHRPEESAAFEVFIDQHYRRFVSFVAEGRGQDFDAVERKARGRVYLGEAAYELGLIDGLGDLNLAIDELKRAAGLSEGVKVRLVEVRERGLRAPLPEPPQLAKALARELGLPGLAEYFGLATSRDPVLYYEPSLSDLSPTNEE